MKLLSKIFGILLCVAGVIGGLYLSLWVCLVGGVVQIIEACKATPVESMGVALGVLRIFLTSLVCWVTVFVCGFIGSCFISAGSTPSYTRRRW